MKIAFRLKQCSIPSFRQLVHRRTMALSLITCGIIAIVIGGWAIHSPQTNLNHTAYTVHHTAATTHTSDKTTGNTPATSSATSTSASTAVQGTKATSSSQSHTATSEAPHGSNSSTTQSQTTSQQPLTDFTTIITHNGQVAPSTLISYDSAKKYKVYYGGDLVFSPSNLYLYQGTDNISNIFTVSIPDGQESNQPEMPWNDVSNVAYPEIYQGDWDGTGYLNGGTSGPGTSWKMMMPLYPGNPAPGVYTIHLTTIRTQSADGGYVDWEYDGFITYTIYPQS
jgi:hypothetical protein